MTNTPGGTPEDPGATPPPDEVGYWGQQAQPQPPVPPAYGSPGYPPTGYGPPSYGGVQYAPDHPKSTTVLVLGICSLVVCGFLGPFAWSMGNKAVREIDESQGRLGGRGQANAGRICGIISSILLALGVLFVVVFVVLGVATFSTAHTNT